MTQLDHVNTLVRAAVKLQTHVNSGTHQEALNILASGKERESHEAQTKEGRKRAGHILTQLASLIDIVDP